MDCDKFAKLGIEVISPKQESCLESLERTDVLISANSTIFLRQYICQSDAIIMILLRMA